jgi:hypothetical protein
MRPPAAANSFQHNVVNTDVAYTDWSQSCIPSHIFIMIFCDSPTAITSCGSNAVMLQDCGVSHSALTWASLKGLFPVKFDGHPILFAANFVFYIIIIIIIAFFCLLLCTCINVFFIQCLPVI